MDAQEWGLLGGSGARARGLLMFVVFVRSWCISLGGSLFVDMLSGTLCAIRGDRR